MQQVPSSCFVAGTLIHTINGLKPIEDIEVGDLVASKNDQTGETDFKPVVQLFRHEDKTVLNLTLETQDGQEEFIQATPEHPFMLENGQWKNAGYLLPGDTVQTHKDRMAKVKSIATDSKRHKVYNFEVADYHTYFVGETGVWVHNDCKGAGSYRPDRELPRDKHGNALPDTDLPHTQLGYKQGRRGQYTQAREWNYNEKGELVLKKDIDFTDHGRPEVHPSPHQHVYIPNETGGTMKRSKQATPLKLD